MITVTELKGRDFKNKEAVQHFLSNGHTVTKPDKGTQYRIDGKVDIYPSSSKIFSIASQKWIDTKGEKDMIGIVEKEIALELFKVPPFYVKKEPVKEPVTKKKLIDISFREWQEKQKNISNH